MSRAASTIGPAHLARTVDELLPTWRDLSLRIHANPELGYEEHNACAWLGDALANAGFTVEAGVASVPTAFRAAMDSAATPATNTAPVVAFLAEYDALPGLGHACGHNLSGVASCLAGHALAHVGREASLPMRLRVMGTPAEEGGGGKIRMLDGGAFDDVAFAMMAHAGFMHLPQREMNGRRVIQISFTAPETAANASHHAGPSLRAADALPPADVTSGNAQDAAMLCLHGVEAVRRETRPRTRIEAGLVQGGQAHGGKLRGRPSFNHAEMELLIVSTEMRYMRRLEQRIKTVADAAATATGTELTWHGQWGDYLPMRRNPALETAYARALEHLGEPIGTFPADWSIGSTDCGNVSQVLPTIHPYFKACEPEAGIDHHTPAFTEVSRSESGLAGMVVAAKAMALTGLSLLTDAELREQIREDFNRVERD